MGTFSPRPPLRADPQYFDTLPNFLVSSRYPNFKYASKMAEKSEVVVLGTHLDDPATRSGMKKVLTRLQGLVPMKAAGIGQKTLLIGDHGVAAMCKILNLTCEYSQIQQSTQIILSCAAHKVVHNLCDASTPVGRCEGLIPGPAEWHKKKVI